MPENIGTLLIREATLPKSWANPPTQMSYSSLTAIESCPRRWALSNSSYPEIWGHRGYPPNTNIQLVQGVIVHRTLQRIISEFVRANCITIKSSQAIQILRNLGGYSTIIDGIFSKLLEEGKNNPRFGPLYAFVTTRKDQFLSSVREIVQTVISQQALSPSSYIASTTAHPPRRFPVHQGSYTEIDVKNPKTEWTGTIDLLNLTTDAIEIVDFKTGQQNQKHAEQLQVYSVLWARDIERNPNHRIATKLTLCYPDQKIAVPPLTEQEITRLEKELAERTDKAKSAITQVPPKAIPNQENCQYCSVRQMCQDYWAPEILSETHQNPQPQKESADIEVQILSQHGPQSWDTKVLASAYWPTNTPLLLRTNAPIQPVKAEQIFRILNAQRVIDAQEPKLAIIVIHGFSEVFLKP